jgi:hypothetical protein
MQWQMMIFFIDIAPLSFLIMLTCNDVVENLVIKAKEVLAVDSNVTSTT